MAHLPEKRSTGRSVVDTIDNAILVGVAVVAALVVLKLIGWIVGTVFFFVKLAALAALIYVVARLAFRSRGR